MGIDVPENHQLVVLEKKIGSRLAVGNFAEKAIYFHGRLSCVFSNAFHGMRMDGIGWLANRFGIVCSYRFGDILVKKTIPTGDSSRPRFAAVLPKGLKYWKFII
ncbi:hypothetical protein DSCA_07220 [Desulfosarcina alkanivorans]|uniref:Uncharacterized protein n=1 Tax=Desulfosarcina alkanivorans TaxID=571177 RepID=A0A5K7YBL7_9BACT|nr:hypothetical protein DSCA_07220 [Desulfosarcina alkanivorans]